MTIDEDSAWAAILQARRAWRQAAPRAAVEARTAAGAALRLETDGRFATDARLDLAAHELLTIFAPLAAAPRFAIGQLGQSLDGRIATRTGDSRYVSGPLGLRHLHRLRAMADAVVVGAGTVAADDPQLTVRHCPGDNPVRVVVDRMRRLAPAHRLFADGQAPSFVLCAPGLAAGPGAPIEVPATVDGFAPRDILAALGARGLHRVLIEGGARTLSRFLDARALDALHVVVAPMIIGSGREAIALPAIDSLDDALRAPVHHHRLGSDMLFALDLT
ncbi:MAG: RibD family protein [Alphaproteobacteria bacterium]|nr:RibD family protein [Alphaproteobacteria bacterium]